ncbi:MAG: hypothetical protein D6711_05550 [Chloroflexi bacterium]|nr:MAG: hypothetical protein D6711_05550 [Chloroflexota bacterium]
MSDVELQNLFNDITDAILTGDETTVNQLAPNVPHEIPLLIHELHTAFQLKQPSDQFVRSLKRDLIGQNYPRTSRVHRLPGRVQLATGIAALVAGLMWVARRRDVRSTNDVDVPVLQQQP